MKFLNGMLERLIRAEEGAEDRGIFHETTGSKISLKTAFKPLSNFSQEIQNDGFRIKKSFWITVCHHSS